VDDAEARELLAHIDGLLDGADDRATELAAALLDLYGEGLARIAAQVPDPQALAGDELVSHLLLLHGLHPVPLEARVRGALDSVQPYLDSHGGGVELVSLDDGVARLKLEGSCSGCPSSTVTLKSAIEDAIHAAAPDVERIEADGVAPAPAPPQGLLQIEMPDRPPPRRAWAHTGALPELDGGRTVLRDVEGEPMLFLRLDRRTYAYRSACPSCGGSLGDAVLSGTELACPGCGHRYDARRAGRCVDAPELHLDPVPLLADHDGGLKVALGTAAPA
jgi:Fe-S cluster biogenesis protein NfuA/nitrite reductase/ring-hydroxylating ferredoxin subunit